MKKLALIFLVLISSTGYLNASEPADVPFASVGINGNFGLNDMYIKIEDDTVKNTDKPGLYFGGGLLYENMITGWFGLGSGFQYRQFEKSLLGYDKVYGRLDIIWSFRTVNIPFYMIFSLAGESISLNFQLGFVYSYIFYSHLKTDDTTTSGLTEDHCLRFTNSNQIGVTTGMNIKFRITDYTDLMIGINSEGYPTNLLKVNGSDRVHLYNCSAIAAWMFRTNLFSR